MDKRKVDQMIPIALQALVNENCNIREKENEKEVFVNKIKKTYRSQISSFGAAVTMGSFKAAIAFFSKDVEKGISRSELIRAMYYIIHYAEGQDNDRNWKTAEAILGEIISISDRDTLSKTKESFLNASIALKLAMNAFELIK